MSAGYRSRGRNATRSEKEFPQLLTNMRAAAKDATIVLKSPWRPELETALEYIGNDELVELTPHSVRLRKRYLKELDRKRAAKKDSR